MEFADWCPNVHRRTRTAGVGAESGNLSTHYFYERLHLLLKHVPASGLLPLWGMRTRPYALRKGHAKFGPAAIRLIHTMCAFWRAFARGMHRRSPAQWTPPSYVQGYLPHRRRENAIAVQQVLTHRLRRAGRSVVKVMYDARNAFGATEHGVLEETADVYARPEDRGLLAQRRRSAVVSLSTPEGALEVHPQCGTTMGDSVAATDFAVAYQRGVAA